MAFTAFHNINTATDGIDVQLINYGERVSLKSLLLTNIDSAAITASLYLQDFSTGTKYYLLYKVSLPVGASLLLDSDDMLKFNNSSTGFSLNLTMGSTSDLINVLMST
jgi:hypothetical protein|tara:strand:+ start:1414 stop:1737 length:324 start_codon:yes stop_codon:yes gene_type:complete